MNPRLVPELDVSDLDRSLSFYLGACSFSLSYERLEERFVYLVREGVELMLQAADGPGRRFRTAPLQAPFGRGVNLQIAVEHVDALYERIVAARYELVVPIEERSYHVKEATLISRQFVVADPDGYLLRFFEDLGQQLR